MKTALAAVFGLLGPLAAIAFGLDAWRWPTGLSLYICAPVGLIAGFVAYTSAILILASGDLARCASLVYWEALLRYVAALVLIPAGLFGDIGPIAALWASATLPSASCTCSACQRK